MSDVHRLEDDVPRYVVAALTALDRPLSSWDLAENYSPPKPNNAADFKDDYRTDNPGRFDNSEFKEWLVRKAVDEINIQNHHPTDGGDVILLGTILDGEFREDELGDDFRVADGVDVDALTIGDNPLVPKQVLPDLFGPETGLWRDNVRSAMPADSKDLALSMEAHGWIPHLPAIADENGVVIIGHRRLQVAAELGITPVMRTIAFGEGPAADAARAALAIASNIGSKPFTPEDRKKIAADLYLSGKFTQTEIGKLLKVSAKTVSYDLRGFTQVKPPKERGGRPRKPKATEEEPTPPPMLPGGVTEDTPGMTDRVKEALAKPQPAPEPDDTGTEPDIAAVLSGITVELDALADYVGGLEAKARLRVFDDHKEAVTGAARSLQRTIRMLNAVNKTRAQGQG